MEYIEIDPPHQACNRCGLSFSSDEGPLRVDLATKHVYHVRCHEEELNELQGRYDRFVSKVHGATWSSFRDMPQWARDLMSDEDVSRISMSGKRSKIIWATNPKDHAVSVNPAIGVPDGFRTTFCVRKYEPRAAEKTDYAEVIKRKNRQGDAAKCDDPGCSDIYAAFVKGTGVEKDHLVVVVVRCGPPGLLQMDEAADKVASYILGPCTMISATDYPASRVCDGACYHWSTPEAGGWAVAEQVASVFESNDPILARTEVADSPLVFAGNEPGLDYVPRIATYHARM